MDAIRSTPSPPKRARAWRSRRQTPPSVTFLPASTTSVERVTSRRGRPSSSYAKSGSECDRCRQAGRRTAQSERTEMFQRLLMTFDGSPHAEQALDEAIDLAQTNSGTLTVIAVAPTPSVWAMSGYDVPIEVDRVSEELEREY